jgi:predicted dehydrogenase
VVSHGSSRALPALPISDTTAALLRFETGASGLLTAIGATANYERTTVFGSKGWAEVRDGSRFAFQPVGGEATTIAFDAFDAERAELEAFAAAVAGEQPFPVPVADAVHSVAVMEAMNRAARSGEPVRIA